MLHYLLPTTDPWLRQIRRTTPGKTIALTFDDGPMPPWTPRVLDILWEKKVQATFFLLGERAERHPDLVERIHAEGHAIGNHTMRHPRLIFHSLSRARKEIDGCNEVLTRIVGRPPLLFRAPHGFLRPGLTRLLAERNMRHVPWTRGVWDTDRPAPEIIVERSTHKPKSLEILLLHDGTRLHDPRDERNATVAAIPMIIDSYRGAGYTFVTIPTLLKDPA